MCGLRHTVAPYRANDFVGPHRVRSCATRWRPTGMASRAIYGHDLTLVGPVFVVGRQSLSQRVLSNIFPLLRVAFVIPQQVIEETWLPYCDSGMLLPDGLCDSLLEVFHRQPECLLTSDPDKQMHVIGHDHVAPDGYAARGESFTVFSERCVDRIRAE